MSSVLIGQRWSLKTAACGTERSFFKVHSIDEDGFVTLVHVTSGRVFRTPRRNLERGMRAAYLVENPDASVVSRSSDDTDDSSASRGRDAGARVVEGVCQGVLPSLSPNTTAMDQRSQ